MHQQGALVVGIRLVDPTQEREDAGGMFWGDEVLPQEVVVLANLMGAQILSLAPLGSQCPHHEV